MSTILEQGAGHEPPRDDIGHDPSLPDIAEERPCQRRPPRLRECDPGSVAMPLDLPDHRRGRPPVSRGSFSAPVQRRPASEAERRVLLRMFAGCMRGRVMYAVPYTTAGEMPTPDLGIELTGFPWVVLDLGLAECVGPPALRRICDGHRWAASVHSVAYPLLDGAGTRRPDVPWPCNAEKWNCCLPRLGRCLVLRYGLRCGWVSCLYDSSGGGLRGFRVAVVGGLTWTPAPAGTPDPVLYGTR